MYRIRTAAGVDAGGWPKWGRMFIKIKGGRAEHLHCCGHVLIGVTSAQTCLVLPERLRAFADAGFRVSLVSAPGQLLDRMRRDTGAETYALAMRRGISPVADGIAFFRMWRLIRRLRPDAVEFSTPKAGFLGSMAAKLCGVPARIYLLRGLKLETARGVKRLLLLGAERISAACAHAVICNSPSLRERARELRIASESKLMVLGEGSSNGVDTRRFRPDTSRVREHLGIPDDAPVIGFVGRLTRDKGVPELMEAFSLLLRRKPEAYLLLVGWFDAAEDALDRGLRERIEGHPRVIQTGFVEDTSPFYRAMNVLVLPSWREGFPNVVLEAAASGVPVVATDCTGSCDAVLPGVTGLLIPPGKPDAICAAVVNVLGHPERLRSMATAGRAWVSESYESRHVLGRTVAFYRRMMGPATDPVTRVSEGIGETATGLSVLR